MPVSTIFTQILKSETAAYDNHKNNNFLRILCASTVYKVSMMLYCKYIYCPSLNSWCEIDIKICYDVSGMFCQYLPSSGCRLFTPPAFKFISNFHMKISFQYHFFITSYVDDVRKPFLLNDQPYD